MTEIPVSLSAKFVGTFAYATIKDRLPVILTKIIDTLHRMRYEIGGKYGNDAQEQVKDVVGRLSKLRNELQTDKPLTPITDDGKDVDVWNQYLHTRKEYVGQNPSWFTDTWLYVECYMYRRIHEAFQLSKAIRGNIQPFVTQKEDSFVDSLEAIKVLLDFLMKTQDNRLLSNEKDKLFNEFLKACLWGNKCDLSISALSENVQNVDPLSQIELLQSNILVDHSQQVLEFLKKLKLEKNEPVKVCIVLDNAGFELVTDLCFAEYLITCQLADTIYFYGKSIPWFVSDVTGNDLPWTIKSLASSDHASLSHFGKKWEQRIQNNSWIYIEHDFWTTPYDFSQMKKVAPVLYDDLSNMDLIFLKGDLNYRKLCGDLQWPLTTPYDVALRGFHPAPHCALRTLKADIVVGLESGKDKEIESVKSDWMVTGEYAVVQWSNMRA